MSTFVHLIPLGGSVGRTAKIANRDVPIEDGEIITVFFSGGARGEKEAGDYDFWTVFNAQGQGSAARCRHGTEPEKRFADMEGRKEYRKHWEVAAAAKVIRPATQEDVEVWLNGHDDDARFAKSARVGSRTMTVVGTQGNYRLE